MQIEKPSAITPHVFERPAFNYVGRVIDLCHASSHDQDLITLTASDLDPCRCRPGSARRFATSAIGPHNRFMLTWLIDMGYVTKASKSRFKLDYVKAREWIERKLQDRCQAIIFNSVDKRWGVDRGLVQFYHTIQQAGFTVNLYQMEGGAQKQVDVAIAAIAVYKATQGDTIVLSSGDLDFLPAVTLITQQIRAKLILFTYDFGFHDDLRKAASEHWMIEDHPELERVG